MTYSRYPRQHSNSAETNTDPDKEIIEAIG